MRVLFLTKYDRLGASSRLRSFQYVPRMGADGIECVVEPLVSDSLLKKRYETGQYGRRDLLAAYWQRLILLGKKNQFDLVWIEKEAFPWIPVFLESSLLKGMPYVLDYDDAVFHNYDLHRNRWVRYLFGFRLDRLMSKATLVIGGNNYLAKRAIDAGAPWVEVIPTVIDLNRYPSVPHVDASTTARIVWIGSPSTVHYLNLLREPLKRLALEIPFVLLIVGATGIEIPGVDVEFVPWTESTEVDSISSCSVGIMPLEDSPWEKGKCGYKLIQYMACSLPVVASAIGANVEIVENGKTGYLASSDDEWVTALRTLLESPQLRREMGEAGRARVEETYCLQKTGPRMVELLRTASKK